MDADPYLAPRLEGNEYVNVAKDFGALEKHLKLKTPTADKTKLLYHVNTLTGVYCLCILPSGAPDVLAIAHEKGHLGFA